MKRSLAIALAGMALAAPAQAVPLDSTFLVTRPSGLGPLTAGITNDSFSSGEVGEFDRVAGRRLQSADGRYIAFVSSADGLSALDADTVSNVYVRDNQTNTTLLVSRAAGLAGAAANGFSDQPSISADGQWVAFRSSATNLFDGDEGATTHVFKRNLITGATELVDRADGAAGVIANDGSSEPSISEDGSAVAFQSFASNMGDADGRRQIYVRDGTSTELASALHTTDTPGDESSVTPSLSADGTRVAFASDEELVPGDDNNLFSDVYVRELGSNNTILMSRVDGGSAVGNSDSHSPSIASDDHASDDYRVAFASTATNLHGADTVNDLDVYVRRGGSQTDLISRASGPAGARGNGEDLQPSISNEGRWVAFHSTSSNLSTLDTNTWTDVYVRTLDLPPGAPGPDATIFASRGVGAAVGTAGSGSASISPTGTRVVFDSQADNFHPDDDNDFSQVFSRVLVISLGEPTRLISRPSGQGVFRSGTNDSSSRNVGRSTEGVRTVSADGRFVAFVSEADEMSAVDDNRWPNVFVRDNVTNQTVLVSRASGEGAAGNGPSGPFGPGGLAAGAGFGAPSISADGRRVAFASLASNLVPNDNNGVTDVFVRDLGTGATQLASRFANDAPSLEESGAPMISADGNRVAFTSSEELVPADDGNVFNDIYVRDLVAGTTVLVSRQNGAGGPAGNSHSGNAVINAAGTRVAWVTDANNLVPALIDTNGDDDVYMRDLGANTTVPVSVRNVAATTGNTLSRSPAINAAGTRVAFASFATNLVTSGDVNGADSDIFVRDLSAGTTQIVSLGPAGVGGNTSSDRPAISGDGTRIAFESRATDLSPLVTVPGNAVFMRDIAAGSTVLISRGNGANGAAANSESGNAAMSANGSCVAFDSWADNLVANPAGRDFLRTYIRAVGQACAVGPAGQGPADVTDPRFSNVRLTRKRFRVGRKRTPVSAQRRRRAPAGTVIRFSLSEAAAVTVSFQRALPGRRVGRRCVKPTRRNRARRPCKRWKRAGTLRRAGAQGANRIVFSGRIGRRALRSGAHRLRLRAVDEAGNAGVSRRLGFRIVRR